jgi:hypothetical protein
MPGSDIPDDRMALLLGEGDGNLVGAFYSVRHLFWIAEADDDERDAMELPHSPEHVMALFHDLMCRIVAQAPDDQPTCAMCEAPFSRERLPAGIGVVEPATERPSVGLVVGVCRDCCLVSDDAMRMQHIRQRIVRASGCLIGPMSTHGQVGHA